jgi:DNA repair protein RadD
MQLRPYQLETVESVYGALKRGAHPAAQLATGTGKSLIIAEICARELYAGRRTWVLTHAQQLVAQNAETFLNHRGLLPGVVCSGLNRAEYDEQVVFGTLQSVITPALRGDMPCPDLIIVDEAHRVSHKTGEQGMYGRLFERYPTARRLAMTATPWRMDGGLIYGKGEQFWFNDLCYRYTVPQAVTDGYLSPLVGVETTVQLDVKGVKTTGADFNTAQLDERQTNKWLAEVAESLKELAGKRRYLAVYCPTVKAALRAQAELGRITGWDSKLITGATKAAERADLLSRWRAGEFRMLFSVDTLTTGFDFPALDCIVCLRPTQSSALWVQIQGRGTRLAEGKRNCLLLDYVGNLQRLGGVDMLETYVRQRDPGQEVSARAPEPEKPKKERRFLPGVSSLAPIDPMTGEQAKDGAELLLAVHASSVVALKDHYSKIPGEQMLMRTFTCTTPEGARITASAFTHPESPAGSKAGKVAAEVMRRWRVPARLPSAADVLSWQSKSWPVPVAVVARKKGKYWNVVTEYFENEKTHA